uniref:Uncharacterized protein LOC105134973 n=1 Tax=Rhizophora mucronata TaxID=61149 RepID=A0A2P2JVK0_RHIMU
MISINYLLGSCSTLNNVFDVVASRSVIAVDGKVGMLCQQNHLQSLHPSHMQAV